MADGLHCSFDGTSIDESDGRTWLVAIPSERTHWFHTRGEAVLWARETHSVTDFTAWIDGLNRVCLHNKRDGEKP